MHPRIRDPFDLTLECIRRHYEGRPSLLTGALGPYAASLALFGDFTGYVDHFLFNDLVEDDRDEVRLFTAFDDFRQQPLPAGNVSEYREFMKRSMDFVRARNERITVGQSPPGDPT